MCNSCHMKRGQCKIRPTDTANYVIMQPDSSLIIYLTFWKPEAKMLKEMIDPKSYPYKSGYPPHSPSPEGWWPEYPAGLRSALSQPSRNLEAGSGPCSQCSSWSFWSPRGWWSSPSRNPTASPPHCPTRPCQAVKTHTQSRANYSHEKHSVAKLLIIKHAIQCDVNTLLCRYF